MNHTRLWLASTIIAMVIIISFVLSVPHTRDLPKAPSIITEAIVVPPVTLHDSFKKGMHTITGSLEAPNACTSATVGASLVGEASSTQRIGVAVTLGGGSGVCLQLPTRLNFSVTIAALAQLPITATVNGSEASTTNS